MRSTLLFNPYLTTLGGGERFIYALAKYARSTGAKVTIASPTLPDERLLAQFGFDTSFELVQVAMEEITQYSRDFDRLIYLTNLLPQPSLARKSYLVVQFPFDVVPWWRKVRTRYRATMLLRGYRCIVYSTYVRTWLRKRWHTSSRILPPLVEMGRYEPAAKEPLILAVGRFFAAGHSKRQDVLIDAFLQLPRAMQDSWRLCLAGGAKDDEESRLFVDALRAKAAGHNISIEVNASQARVNALYGSARLFWHGAGYGRSEDAPEKAEHFGITTVEAMSSGCVPLVYDDGGQAEIVASAFGRRWRTIDELAGMTAALAGDSPAQDRMATVAVREAQRYDEASFMAACRRVFGE